MTTARKTRSTTKRRTTAKKKPSTAKKQGASASRFTKKPTAAKATTAQASAATANPFAPYMGESQDWMKNSSEMMQKFFQQTPTDFSDWKNKMPSFAAPQSSSFGKNMDATTRKLSETMARGSDSMQLLTESGNSLANMAREFSKELAQVTNNAFSEQVELSKELLQCRNINDMFELQTKSAQQTVEKIYAESMRLSDMLFKTAAEISEPIQQRATQTAERLSKKFK